MPRYIVRDYLNCTRCPLHEFRRNVVFGRGDLPADVLFVGEGPGKSEDLLGKPFVGPSGRLLDHGIVRAASLAGTSVPRHFISNICGCRPTDRKFGENREPSGEEAYACWPRLDRTYRDVRPRKIVLLGDTAKKYGLKAWPDAVCLTHPAAILRAGGAESPVFRMFCRNLSEVFRKLSNE